MKLLEEFKFLMSKEYLKKIQQGVKSWNKWKRYVSSPVYLMEVVLMEADLKEVDLSKAYLNKSNFSGTNFNSANFKNSYLCDADFRRTNLVKANFSDADLSCSNFNEAHLIKADLTNANLLNSSFNDADLSGVKASSNFKEASLKRANLIGADLSFSNFNNADLREANLKDSNLLRADFSGADLSGADLSGANLTDVKMFNSILNNSNFNGANLRNVNLNNSILCNVNLYKANLWQTDLSGTNLRDANLELSILVKTNLTNANITGVNLYATAREEWIINNIRCDYFYNDSNRKTRIPNARDFKKGEFEERYEQLATFEFIFEKGFSPIDAFIMDQVVQAINEQQPEIELKLDSFHSRGQPRAVFTVFHREYTEDALKQITYQYEQKIKYLEGKNEALNDVISSYINKPQQLIQGKNITMGDNIQFSGNGNVAFGKDHATVNQTNVDNSVNKKILTEIQKLKDEISKLTIDQTNKEAIDIQFETLENYAKSDKKNPVLMKSTLESIKAITQGALGSAIGAGLIETFKRVGMMIM